MEGKLQQITDKIYSEGVEKAQRDSQTLLEKARVEGDKILQKARDEAEALVLQARQTAESLDRKVKEDLSAAAKRTVEDLKKTLGNLISKQVLEEGLASALESPEVVAQMLVQVVQAWKAGTGAPELEVALAPQIKAQVETLIKKQAAGLFSAGITFSPDRCPAAGFRVAPRDGSWTLSFSPQEFEDYFKSWLGPKAREILFPGSGQ